MHAVIHPLPGLTPEASWLVRVSVVSPARAQLNPDRLRRAREHAGLTQHQLARVIDVAGGERVSRWELGLSIPRPEVLRRVADALGVQVAQLLEEGEERGLREMRLGAGLTLAGLGKAALVSTRTVHRWETGDFKRLPHEETIKLLAHALGVRDSVVRQALRAARDSRN